MKPNRAFGRLLKMFPQPATSFALGMLCAWEVWGDQVVTNCTEADLRTAMAPGGVVTFACDGTIVLSQTITGIVNTVLDGSGHAVTLSGGNSVRIFYVSPNVTFSVDSLALANGASANGAAIFNDGGSVRLVGTALEMNTATFAFVNGAPTAGEGAAVYNKGGLVTATNCNFTGNLARQFTNCDLCYMGCRGGAIYNDNVGKVELWNCTFAGNQAIGVDGESSYPYAPKHPLALSSSASGGAIHSSGTLLVNACTFAANLASGGGGGHPGPPCDYACTSFGLTGGSGSDGIGGAIYNVGPMEISASTFSSNNATGGTGGQGGPGPAWSWGIEGGMGGIGGSGLGSALYNGASARLVNCTLTAGISIGGSGGAGGIGGSALSSDAYGGRGGAGGPGGSGTGSIYDSSGGLTLVNCTIALNTAASGSGGAGGEGGYGGRNGGRGSAGSAGANGSATAGVKAYGTVAVNTILNSNAPGGNCSGMLRDYGHNLSSDGTCNFTNLTSLNNTDPKLGPLADNGGPTWTMAINPTSPALDAGDSFAGPATDQRAFPRPAGGAGDIGAFEYCWPPVLRVSGLTATQVEVSAYCDIGNAWCLCLSTDLLSWTAVATSQIPVNGKAVFHDDRDTHGIAAFYRLRTP